MAVNVLRVNSDMVLQREWAAAPADSRSTSAYIVPRPVAYFPLQSELPSHKPGHDLTTGLLRSYLHLDTRRPWLSLPHSTPLPNKVPSAFASSRATGAGPTTHTSPRNIPYRYGARNPSAPTSLTASPAAH